MRILILMICIALAGGCRYVNDADDTAFHEFKASSLLKKYEWFKDASASLDAKRASITIYEQRFKNLSDQYKGVPRSTWARDDREQYNLWQGELAGITASYNSLAADYNSQMSKANWAFCNTGDLPAGASSPLPREFKPYIEAK